ncbi:MAG: hypothetical protein ACI4EU_08395 [Butyrivibrio sp.]
MKCLKKNMRQFWYALFEKAEETKDANGNYSGLYKSVYTLPRLMSANISAARGTTNEQIFGVDISYDKTISTADMNCPISETSVLWIDNAPVINSDGTTDTPWDYIVSSVAKSLNSVTYAVKKVDVSNG